MKIIAVLIVFSLSACVGLPWNSSKKVSTNRGISATELDRVRGDLLPQLIKWSKPTTNEDIASPSYRVIEGILVTYNIKKRYKNIKSFWGAVLGDSFYDPTRHHHDEDNGHYPSTEKVVGNCMAGFSGTLSKDRISTSSRVENKKYNVDRELGVMVSGGDENGVDYTQGQYILATYAEPINNRSRVFFESKGGSVSGFICETGDKVILSKQQFERMVKASKK